MKKLIFILSCLISLSALADSVKTEVGSFQGRLIVEREKLDIESIEVEIVNQFCNFWGTTCAGGPSDRSGLAVANHENADGSILFVHDGESELSSLKIGNRFSSCNVYLKISALDSKGQRLTGSKSLAWINDKKTCSSKKAMTDIVRKNLEKPLSVTEGFNYVSIK